MLISEAESITSPAINLPRNSSNLIVSEPVLDHKVRDCVVGPSGVECCRF